MVAQAVVERLAGMLTNIVLARVLGTKAFGAYSIIATTANSVYGITRMGVETALVVRTTQFGANGDTESQGEMLGAGLWLMLLAAALALFTCIVFAELIASGLLADTSLTGWIRIAGLWAFCLCLTQFCYAAMSGLQHFVAYSKVAAILAVTQTLAVSIAAWMFSLAGAVWAMIAAQSLCVAILAITLRRQLGVRQIFATLQHFDDRARELLAFGLPFYAASLVALPVTYYLQSTLARRAGLETLGYLRVILAFATIVTFVPTTTATTILVMLTTSTRTEHYATRIIQSIKFISLLSMVVAGALTLALPTLLPLFFGARYDHSIVAAQIAVVSAALATISQVVTNVLLSVDRVKLAFLATAMHMFIFFVGGAFLVTSHGLMGYVFADFIGHSTRLIGTYGCALPWLRRHGTASQDITKLGAVVSLFAIGNISIIADRPFPPILFQSCVQLAVCILGYYTILDGGERHILAHTLGSHTLQDFRRRFRSMTHSWHA